MHSACFVFQPHFDAQLATTKCMETVYLRNKINRINFAVAFHLLINSFLVFVSPFYLSAYCLRFWYLSDLIWLLYLYPRPNRPLNSFIALSISKHFKTCISSWWYAKAKMIFARDKNEKKNEIWLISPSKAHICVIQFASAAHRRRLGST